MKPTLSAEVAVTFGSRVVLCPTPIRFLCPNASSSCTLSVYDVPEVSMIHSQTLELCKGEIE